MAITFSGNDLVRSCPLLERGVRFWNKGVFCCCAVTKSSPMLVSAEEMMTGKANYDLVVKRRQHLFDAFNGLNDTPLEGCADAHLSQQKKLRVLI